MEERDALVILNNLAYLGAGKARQLVHQCSSARKILELSAEDLANVPFLTTRAQKSLSTWKDQKYWKQDLDLIEKYNIKIISYEDKLYPRGLKDVENAPLILYIYGDLLPEDQQSLAVVGTRAAGIYAREMAHDLSGDLGAKGYTVVSGLARGVDTAAHRGALEKGRTIAVIGSGLTCLYPPENRDLAKHIADNGAVISELPMLMPPDRMHFPKRNRLLAGMTQGALLIEAPIKSGAMITMERAKKYRRKLFALPGRADHQSFAGNHYLIKSGQAQLIETVDDICQSFGDFFSLLLGSDQKKQLEPALLTEEKILLDKMPVEELTVDEIIEMTSLAVSRVNVALMGLVLKKRVREYPGKIYKKIKR